MSNSDLLRRYNYDEFVPAKFTPWLNFDNSPPLGEQGPDFPLWTLEGEETRLSRVLGRHGYTIVEFGSFT